MSAPDLSGHGVEELLDAYASLTHRLHALRIRSGAPSASLADAVASVREQRRLVREEIVRRAS